MTEQNVQNDDPRAVAEQWRAAEPDDDIRQELDALLAGPDDELAARFDGRLQFGTAGLRGEVGAGPLRMNRLLVRQAAAGLGLYLLENDERALERGVIVGYDARRKSDVFALDTARVLGALGIPTRLFDQTVPTPVLAWSITDTDSAAGVVVTASHNPPADNGYKVFLADGAQIVPPHDSGIAACIDRVDATAVPMVDADHGLINFVGDEIIERYLAFVPSVRLCPDVEGVVAAYTAMHGVGGATIVRAFERAGLPAPVVVDEQFEPDGSFPTVSFPNPEEPGAMDLLLATAAASGAAVALANDPDADRLGAAIPQPDGTWRRLGGDEIGWLLADHILKHTSGDDRFVVTTLVSSSMLSRIADAHGVHSAETFTGFKWIGRTVQDRPELRFVFGYEQALGYLVTTQPLDKDGITAAVLFTEVASVAAAEGVTLQQRLDALAVEFGRHVTAEHSIRMDPVDAARRVAELVDNPPTEIGGIPVASVSTYPEANLLRIVLEGGVRVQVRPSGTEPKVKIYGEAVDADPNPSVAALAALLA